MYKKVFITLFLSILLIGCTNDMENETVQTKNKILTEQQNEASNNEPKTDPPTKKGQGTNPSENLSVHYIDVGQGDATLFQFADKEESYTILYDTGDWKGNEVVPYLNRENIDYIDIIIISHPHADHIGQLAKVLERFDVGEVWMSSNTAESEVYNKAVEAIVQSDADFDEPKAGDVFDIGPLTLTILHPEELTGKLNEDSIGFHAQYGNISFLFTGDASSKEEKMMIQRDVPIEATFLQLGHHGSNTSSDISFIEAVNPDVAIYSAGKDNTYGHPHEEIVEIFKSKEIPLYGTEDVGNIVVTTDGEKYEMNTDKQKQTKKANEKKNATCININEASLEELQQIKHIGEARAKDVIEHRPYTSVEELKQIDGLGQSRINDIIEEGKACTEE